MTTWIFAAVFAGMALFFTVRLLVVRQDAFGNGSSADRGADLSHGMMSLGMAAMLWPWGNPVPALYWQVLFSIIVVWFAARLLRSAARSATLPQPGLDRAADLHHMLASMAMVYMLAAVPAGQHMTHGMEMPGSGIALPVLAWAFIAYFLVFAVWLGARLVQPVSTVAATTYAAALLGDGARSVLTSPHLLGSIRVVMGIGMSYMLAMML